MSKTQKIAVEDIKIPSDLQAISKKPGIHANFKKCIDAISCEYIFDEGILRITTKNLDVTKKRINMAKDMHFQTLRLAMEMSEIENNKDLIVEEFDVAEDLIGLSLGTKGRNIKEVNSFKGVTADLIRGTCTFRVKAKSKEMAAKARDRLEYVRHCVKVPRATAEAILSKDDGAVIQNVIKKSGITKIEAGDDDLTEDDEEIPFNLIGPAKKVADAVALFEYHVTVMKTGVPVLGSTTSASSEESDTETTSNCTGTSSRKKSKRKSKFRETLVIPKNLMGLAVGKNGSNINKAAKLDGIVDIKARDSSFEIFGNDKEKMAEARKILDYAEELVELECETGERLLSNGKAILREIQNKSEVFRIEIKEKNDQKYVFRIIGQAHRIPIAMAFISIQRRSL